MWEAYHVAEHQKKEESKQVPHAWVEANHPVGGGSEEARWQHTHRDEVKQNCGCEVSRCAVYSTGPLPVHKNW